MAKKKKNKNIKKHNLFTIIKDKIFHEDDIDNNFSMFEVVIIIIISILFGIIIGYIITCGKLSPANDKNLSEIVDVYDKLTSNYYDKVDKSKLSDAAIKGMVESLDDPYTNYMDVTTANEFNRTIDGSFVGIGVTVQYEEDGYYRVIEIMQDTPASKSDLRVDDILLRVDGMDIAEDETAFSSITNGKVGTKVILTVKRGEDQMDITLKRAVIELKIVHNSIFDYEGMKVGYVKIDSFSVNSYKQFERSMNRFDKNNIDVLVIDVRDNPGGNLARTREILSKFFDRKTVLYQIKTPKVTKKIKSLNSETKDYPIAVLINNGSASASEILASCFQENYDKAIIVGEKSYGKGTIQNSQSLSSGTSIKYTTEKWLTSKGKYLGDKGVKPDVEVAASAEYYENQTYSTDNQLQEALKKLKESK